MGQFRRPLPPAPLGDQQATDLLYSRYLKERFLQSIAVPRAIKLQPQPVVEPQTTFDVLSRSRRSILLCSRYDCSCRQIRFRLIYPMPSLLNRRGNNLHTADVNTTWYVHREGVPRPQRQGNNCHIDAGAIFTLTCCPSKASALEQLHPPLPPRPSLKVSRQRSHPYM